MGTQHCADTERRNGTTMVELATLPLGGAEAAASLHQLCNTEHVPNVHYTECTFKRHNLRNISLPTPLKQVRRK